MSTLLIAAVSGPGLLSLLLNIVVAALIFWLLYWLITFVAPPEPFRKVLTVILAIVAVVYLINLLLGLTGNAFIAL